jgi:hypothetical protein
VPVAPNADLGEGADTEQLKADCAAGCSGELGMRAGDTPSCNILN